MKAEELVGFAKEYGKAKWGEWKAKRRTESVINFGTGWVQKKAGAYRLGNAEYDMAREFTKRGDAKGLKDLVRDVKKNPFDH